MLGNSSGSKSQSKALGFISISLSLCITVTLSLPLSLYSFCSGHNIDCDSGIFLGFALFGYCVLLLFIAFGICNSVCFNFVY